MLALLIVVSKQLKCQVHVNNTIKLQSTSGLILQNKNKINIIPEKIVFIMLRIYRIKYVILIYLGHDVAPVIYIN